MIDWQTDKLKEELPLLRRNHFVVVDIETTGLSPDKGGRIIELAAVRVVNGVIKDRFETFIDPQMKISPKITTLTTITNEMVQGKPTINEVLPQFYKFLRDAVLVAHNAAFDWTRFLVPGLQKVGIFPKNDSLCTLKLIKRVLPGRGRGGYTLDNMCALLEVPLENHHRAIDDVLSTAKCLISFIHLFAPESLTTNDSPIEQPAQIEHTPVNIKQIRYWEKKKNPREMFRRQYVRLSTGSEFGTVYFDIPTQTWGNKDFPLPLDFNQVELSVLQFLNMASRQDLIHFRN